MDFSLERLKTNCTGQRREQLGRHLAASQCQLDTELLQHLMQCDFVEKLTNDDDGDEIDL